MSSNGSTRKQARYRARLRAGVAILRIPVPLLELQNALVDSDRLTPAEALRRDLVEAEASELLVEWARHWQ